MRIDVGKRSAEQWTTIHRDIYVELVAALGVEAHDNAVKKLNLSARHTGNYLQQHEIFDVVEAMIQHSVSGGAGVHVLLDECQRRMEYYERGRARAQIDSWFELLKNIAEAVSRGGGRLLITTTPSPWDGAPQHVRHRFVDLRADAPMAGEIQAFIMEGLKHVDKDKPDQADAGLGALVKAKHPALITPRQLHDLLWKMWNKARSAGASMLVEEHLP
ncbi:hypothetical protein WMF26_22920 [Sorangium sp. So ce185]|uniref:hypothetical protein n=1 Tax=Sorangium sp. So ce185 TaxID=3133287 RepID=UPI003F5EC1C6